jgi:DNA mismatch endonuclease (patch repair protein)
LAGRSGDNGMADFMSSEQRSALMSKVHGKDTEIERCLRSLLHRRGFRFRKNVKGLPGRPDIVLAKHKAAIFVHGCFWHCHSGCRRSRLPTTRAEFWHDKARANQERDSRKITDLSGAGWRVAVVWECALVDTNQLPRTVDALCGWIVSREEWFEIPCEKLSPRQ